MVRLPSQSQEVRLEPMTLYVLRRLGLAVLIVCLSMLFLLSAIHLVPGDPAGIALGPRASPEMCQWRSKKGPPWRCKKGPLGGCGLVP